MFAERVVDILELVHLEVVDGHYLLEVLLPFLAPLDQAFTSATGGLFLALGRAALRGGAVFEGLEFVGWQEVAFGFMLITMATFGPFTAGSASIVLILLGLAHGKVIVLRK